MTSPLSMTTYTIYKYTFNEIMNLPTGAQILSVQYQRNELQMWCLIPVETMVTTVTRHFIILGTGHHFQTANNSLKYLATVQENDGQFVWHIFEKF